jgi:hypothetical protein
VIFVESATEFSTGLLAAVLALVALGAAIVIESQYEPWRGRLWYWGFVLLGLAAALGALGHGVQMSFAIYRWIWHVINFLLPISLALLVANAADARWGRLAGKRALLLGLLVAVGYFVATLFFAGVYFGAFLGLAAVGQLLALWAYLKEARVGTPGAAPIALGLTLSLVATLVQLLGSPGLPLLLQLDSNGIFLLLEVVAVLLVAVGAARDLAGR